jgi:hypothetical protein
MKPRPEFIVAGPNGLCLTIYRLAPPRRHTWRNALLLSIAVWLLALMTLVHAADRPALQKIRYVTNVDATIAAAEWVPVRTCRGWWN